MVVSEKKIDDHAVTGLNSGVGGGLCSIFKSAIDAVPRRLANPSDGMPRSAGWATRVTGKYVNSASSDIAHLHWVNGALLSIEEIGKIRKPLVWTLHDMWPFCGSEHLAPDKPEARWRTGYLPSTEITGFDIDRWCWKRKKASWQNSIHIVAPSRWMADCVRSSSLMSEFPVYVIPNALNVDVYKPMGKSEARHLLNLPQNQKLVLFGAIKGTQLSYKGWDLLMPALSSVVKEFSGAAAVIFGQSKPAEPMAWPFQVHWMGHLHDDFTLAALYSASDVLVIPSRQEAFGQTGSEAQACGCPVVAFNATGLKDVVENEVTGFLVNPYESSALASAVVKILKSDALRCQFGFAARERALRLWSASTVVEQYTKVYEIAALQR